MSYSVAYAVIILPIVYYPTNNQIATFLSIFLKFSEYILTYKKTS